MSVKVSFTKEWEEFPDSKRHELRIRIIIEEDKVELANFRLTLNGFKFLAQFMKDYKDGRLPQSAVYSNFGPPFTLIDQSPDYTDSQFSIEREEEDSE